MARRRLIRTDKFPYHVVARTNNKENFWLPMTDCWEIFQDSLKKAADVTSACIHSFVLMNNHFHLFIKTPNANIDEVMFHLMCKSSRGISRRAERINHVYGGPYRWSLVQDDVYQSTVYKYIYRNPVRANVSRRVEDYPYSTFQYELGYQTLPYRPSPIACTEIPLQLSERVMWLNEEPHSELEKATTKALRRRVFKYSGDKSLRSLIKSESCQKMTQ